jgi:hypothetical protein
MNKYTIYIYVSGNLFGSIPDVAAMSEDDAVNSVYNTEKFKKARETSEVVMLKAVKE